MGWTAPAPGIIAQSRPTSRAGPWSIRARRSTQISGLRSGCVREIALRKNDGAVLMLSRSRCQWLVGLASLMVTPIALCVISRADVLIIASAASSVHVGERLKDQQRLALADGEAVTILLPDGSQRRLSGPVDLEIASLTRGQTMNADAWRSAIADIEVTRLMRESVVASRYWICSATTAHALTELNYVGFATATDREIALPRALASALENCLAAHSNGGCVEVADAAVCSAISVPVARDSPRRVPPAARPGLPDRPNWTPGRRAE